MLYLIDGYNFLFRCLKDGLKIENQRNELINFFDMKAKELKIKIIIVFDAQHQKNELSTRSYTQNIQIVYTPANQTADDYILEKIEYSKDPSQITLVTSDNKLSKKAKFLNAKTKSIELFLSWITEQEKNIELNEEKEFEDTKENIKRLLKIFNEKMKKNSDD